MNRKQIKTLCFAFLAMLLAGCTNDSIDFAPDTEHPEGSIVLRLGSGGSANTRTQLEGSYDLHHVEQVYVILYEKGEGDDAPYTYVTHQDLNWNPSTDPDYAEGEIQKKAFELDHQKFRVEDGKTYALLCVGLDDESGVTYNLKMGEGSVPAFCNTGKTLEDAKAVLATGESMTHAELFAGWESFTYSARQVNEVNVDMYRRVAGMYAYLKDVPVSIESQHVKYIRLVLGNTPPNAIALQRKRGDGITKVTDFGEGKQGEGDPEKEKEAKVLDVIDMNEIASYNEGDLFYTINPDYTKALKMADNTLLLSAYVLPMDAGTANTFSVELLNEGRDIIKSFPAVWDAAQAPVDTRKFPVYTNYIYHVGTRSKDKDAAVSLAGDRLELVVERWEDHDLIIDFPGTAIGASFDYKKYKKNPDKYIYDCINTTETITILPSLLKQDWNLTIMNMDEEGNLTKDCDWLYFMMADGTYPQEYSSKGLFSEENPDVPLRETDVTLQLRMNDFVEKRDIEGDYNPNTPSGREKINNDWRRACLVLNTEGSDLDVLLPITQYNAITVEDVYHSGIYHINYACGLSRFDIGAERDADGNVIKQGIEQGWGFWESGYDYIHKGFTPTTPNNKPQYNGELCYDRAKVRDADKFIGSFIQVGYCESFEYNGKDNKNAHYWYLPSRYELFSFFDQIVRHKDIITNIKENDLYWSSSVHRTDYTGRTFTRSYRQKTDDIDLDGWSKRETGGPVVGYTTVLGRGRRARKFSDFISE